MHDIVLALLTVSWGGGGDDGGEGRTDWRQMIWGHQMTLLYVRRFRLIRAPYRGLNAFRCTELLCLQPGYAIGQCVPVVLDLHSRALGI